jgi:hypothetical protein
MNKALLPLLLLTGCATVETDFVVPPHLSHVNVTVRWLQPGEGPQKCGPGRIACAVIGQHNGAYVAMWAEKPTGFNDRVRVETIGHEFLHLYGARHQQ